MKKLISFLLLASLLITCAGCSLSQVKDIDPSSSQMKAICELAVVECYYHNVAKFYEENDEKGLLNLFGLLGKDKHFWIEYSGRVKVGVDISLVNVSVDETEVAITLPEAQVLACTVDSTTLSESSFIVDKSSAKIKAEDEVTAFAEAQNQLMEAASGDKILLSNAQERAKTLLEQYIHNIGKAVGKQYSINWIYVDTDGNPSGQTAYSPAPEINTDSALVN